MENTSDSFIPRPLLFCLESERSVCYSVPDNTLIDRLINKVYIFPGDRIEIEYATQDFLETKESEKEV